MVMTKLQPQRLNLDISNIVIMITVIRNDNLRKMIIVTIIMIAGMAIIITHTNAEVSAVTRSNVSVVISMVTALRTALARTIASLHREVDVAIARPYHHHQLLNHRLSSHTRIPIRNLRRNHDRVTAPKDLEGPRWNRLL
jgi:hypothetical protein